MNASLDRIWIHDECLGLADQTDAFFILDWELYKRRDWSANRVYFMLSVLRGSGVEVIQGDTISIIQTLLSTSNIYVLSAKDPELADLTDETLLLGVRKLESNEWLVPNWQDKDLKRFSRFWNKVRKQL